MELKETLEFTKKILLSLTSTKIWGLHPEKGWTRPMVISYNDEWYMLANPEPCYFEQPWYDYKEDVESGVYVPTGVKVGEELV